MVRHFNPSNTTAPRRTALLPPPPLPLTSSSQVPTFLPPPLTATRAVQHGASAIPPLAVGTSHACRPPHSPSGLQYFFLPRLCPTVEDAVNTPGWIIPDACLELPLNSAAFLCALPRPFLPQDYPTWFRRWHSCMYPPPRESRGEMPYPPPPPPSPPE